MDEELAVKVDVRGSTGFVLLNRPEQRNAMSADMRRALREALEEMALRQDVRAVVIGSTGKAFCAGGDLKSLSTETGPSNLERQYDTQLLVRAIMTGDKPVIAAVEGVAVGSGLSIALACDIVVAGGEARFGAVFGKVGLAPDLGATWTLPRRVGPGRARLMIYTGRLIGAEQGADWGLVDELVAPGAALAAATAIAGEIAAMAPLPLRIARRGLAQPFAGLDQALEYEAVTQGLLIGTEDFAEGFSAFREKRSAQFKGR